MNEENRQIQIRKEKLEKIKALGSNPYPYSFENSHSIDDIIKQSDTLLEEQTPVSLAGRLMAVRGKGKAMFGHIQSQHKRLQIYIRQDEVGEASYKIVKLCDIGDYLGLTGIMMRTQTGDLTLRVKTFQILSKSIRPLPVPKIKKIDGETIVFDEVSDKELRYRQRYVDLTLNEKVASSFKNCSLIVQTIRNYLLNNQFLEVDTPILQSIYGGANASPFETHHNALGINFFLRISNELYLKRLVGGGFDRVFEFSKNFRNEGIDRTHNPEFTVLEFYQAYADYSNIMTHCEKIWEACVIAVHGSTKFEYQGVTIDVKAPWKRLPMLEAVETVAHIPFSQLNDEEVQNLLMEKGWKLDGEYSRGRALQMVFEETCESSFVQPIFIIDHPKESTPLCKAHRENPENIERFEAYLNCWEIANAYSELNDPIQQRKLLEEQVERGRGGEEETHPFDHDFVRAMEYGMPPMGGIGMGIERMLMLILNQTNIRDVLLFPTMKPE